MRLKEQYILERKYLKNIADFQLNDFLKEFDVLANGDIAIPYKHESYSCNGKLLEFNKPGVQAISFFSGCGGLDIGTQMAGVRVLSSLDFYEDSVNTMRKNPYFTRTQHYCEDINNVDGKEFSTIIKQNNPEKLIVVGGPPCQPFSKAGYWVTNENRKSNDDPRNMIGSYFRLISEIKPDGFVLENVESLLHPSNCEAVESIVNNIEQLGYNYSLLKINTADYGIPQKRKRVFFIASRKKISANITQTHGNENQIKLNSKLLPYSRVIDWIAPYDTPEFWNEESLSSEGKYEYLSLIHI